MADKFLTGGNSYVSDDSELTAAWTLRNARTREAIDAEMRAEASGAVEWLRLDTQDRIQTVQDNVNDIDADFREHKALQASLVTGIRADVADARMTAGSALSKAVTAGLTADEAKALAQGLAAAGGLTAESPVDGQTAVLLTSGDTLTRAAAESLARTTARSVVNGPVGREARASALRDEGVRADTLGGDVLAFVPAATQAWELQKDVADRPTVDATAGRDGAPVVVIGGTRAEGVGSPWVTTTPGTTWMAEVIYRTLSDLGTPARVIIQTQTGTTVSDRTVGSLPATGGEWGHVARSTAVVPVGAGRVRVLIAGRAGDRPTHIESVTLRRIGSLAPRLGLTGSATKPPAPTRWARVREPVLTKADMHAGFPDMAGQGGIDSIYWPCVVDAKGVAGAPGRWLLYWSTNHSLGVGGIGMAYADSLLGPWTCLGPDPVWRRVVGVETQTETPHVVVLPGGTIRLFYSNLFNVDGTTTQDFQRTDFADSTDGGRTFTYGGKALVYPRNMPGEVHTGYARVYKMGDGYVAYSSATGGVNARQAIWYSSDAAKWRMDRRLIHNSSDVVGDNSKGLDGKFVPFVWGGEWWAAVVVTGATFVARLREDKRGVTGPFHPTQGSWLPESIVQDDDGTLWSFRIKSDGNAPGVEAAYLEV